MSSYPMYVGFVASKQEGGLLFPSPAVLRLVKAADVTFSCGVREQGTGITDD